MTALQQLTTRARGPTASSTTPRTTTTPTTGTPTPSDSLGCPACGSHAGFLLDLDGVSYRVLEDERDTDLIAEAGGGATRVTCTACRTTLTAADVLSSHSDETYLEQLIVVHSPEAVRMGPRRGKIHHAGRAHTRATSDGRALPECPECGAWHHFFVDLDGVAFHVMEDDDDTELLEEATNLLCSRCHAVFEHHN